MKKFVVGERVWCTVWKDFKFQTLEGVISNVYKEGISLKGVSGLWIGNRNVYRDTVRDKRRLLEYQLNCP